MSAAAGLGEIAGTAVVEAGLFAGMPEVILGGAIAGLINADDIKNLMNGVLPNF